MKLYHITDDRHLPNIISFGLLSGEDDHTYFITKLDWVIVGYINMNQLCIPIDRIIVLEVDVDEDYYEIKPDNVAEFTAGQQRRVEHFDHFNISRVYFAVTNTHQSEYEHLLKPVE